MELKPLKLLCAIALLFMVSTISAQVFKISAFNQGGSVMGDFSKKEINNSSAGYVDYSSTRGLEFNYYLENNIGFGLRCLSNYYERDTEAFEADLTKMLGISNDQYDLTQGYGFWAFGSDVGISYMLTISKKLQLEPYFYFGFKALKSPANSMVYNIDNTTYQYQSKPQLYLGYNYSPGLKLNWNIYHHIGLNFSMEYDGNSFYTEEERSMVYNSSTLEITDTEKSYNINSLKFGIGLAYRFGKGLAE